MFEVLSADLYKDVIGIKQAATWGVVLKAAADHTAASKQKVSTLFEPLFTVHYYKRAFIFSQACYEFKSSELS